MSAKITAIHKGIFDTGVEIGNIISESVPDDALQAVIAEDLLGLLNRIEADSPRDEFRNVVIGVLAGLGFEPLK